MGSLTLVLSFLSSYILIHLNVALTFAQTAPEILYHNCTTSNNYTGDSPYGANLNALLSSLSSNITEYGFYKSSVGQDPDRANAVALCRGDVELDICRGCVNDSIHNLRQSCPNEKEAILWYDKCMLRYSNEAITGRMEWGPGFNKWNVYTNVTDDYWVSFNEVRRKLLVRLRDKAASGGSHLKYATGEEQLPNYNTTYTLVQCTPDLSEGDCTSCLNACMALIPICCNTTIGGAVYKPTCNVRYELGMGSFYNYTTPGADAPSPPPVTLPLPPPPGKKIKIVIIIVVSIVTFATLLGYISIYLRKRTQKKKTETVDGISTVESFQYDFATIRVATDNFSKKLGQGGFGSVYKGKLPNGQEIAVKRLATGSGQGDPEFKNEVVLMARLQHRNLVRLLGFCLEGTERLLIYEFVINGSLDHFIFDTIKCRELDWDKRHKIIGGIARGLLYLHEDSRLRIIHRDLKASNILLDTNMNPKIADFGMARCFVLDETRGNTNRIAGTYGYIAPEVLQGHISVKSDVYSFGVLVLETLSGKKISETFQDDEENIETLLTYAWKNWREGTTSNLIEPLMRSGLNSISEINRCIQIGLLCVQANVAHRPTMASVVLMLSTTSLTIPSPSRPAFSLHSVETEMPLPEPSNFSANEASITELYPR